MGKITQPSRFVFKSHMKLLSAGDRQTDSAVRCRDNSPLCCAGLVRGGLRSPLGQQSLPAGQISRHQVWGGAAVSSGGRRVAGKGAMWSERCTILGEGVAAVIQRWWCKGGWGRGKGDESAEAFRAVPCTNRQDTVQNISQCRDDVTKSSSFSIYADRT